MQKMEKKIDMGVVNDIYMLTNTDKDTLTKEKAESYLMKIIDKNSQRFSSMLGASLYKSYVQNIYNNLTDRSNDLMSRQSLYDAVISGKMIGGAI